MIGSKTVDGNKSSTPDRFTESTYVNAYLLNGASNDMGVDGSSSAVTFNYSPPAGKILVVGRMIFFLEMALDFDSTKFGGITALTNGVSFTANGVEIANWKDNIDIVTCCYDVNAYDTFTKLKRQIPGRWTFARAKNGSQGITIRETNGFSCIIQDDLSAAGIIFRARIQGELIDA